MQLLVFSAFSSVRCFFFGWGPAALWFDAVVRCDEFAEPFDGRQGTQRDRVKPALCTQRP